MPVNKRGFFVYAVIRTGSKQYCVEAGQELLVEKLQVEPGATVAITDVLAYSDGGDSLEVGTPVLPMTVQCVCVPGQSWVTPAFVCMF